MPVEWIYQLRDGTLGTLDDSGKFVSTEEGGAPPSEENPMVARIAFWADDESTKINVNTASEGAAWDKTSCHDEGGQRVCQVSAGEE